MCTPSDNILFQHYEIISHSYTPKNWALASISKTIPALRAQHIWFSHIFITLFIELASSSVTSVGRTPWTCTVYLSGGFVAPLSMNFMNLVSYWQEVWTALLHTSENMKYQHGGGTKVLIKAWFAILTQGLVLHCVKVWEWWNIEFAVKFFDLMHGRHSAMCDLASYYCVLALK